jgi:hypothetical protein
MLDEEDQNRTARKLVISHFKKVFFSKQVITDSKDRIRSESESPREKKRNTHKAKQSNFLEGNQRR